MLWKKQIEFGDRKWQGGSLHYLGVVNRGLSSLSWDLNEQPVSPEKQAAGEERWI